MSKSQSKEEKVSHPFLRNERGYCGHSESHQVISFKPRLDVEATSLGTGKILKFSSVFPFCFEFSQIYEEKNFIISKNIFSYTSYFI